MRKRIKHTWNEKIISLSEIMSTSSVIIEDYKQLDSQHGLNNDSEPNWTQQNQKTMVN